MKNQIKIILMLLCMATMPAWACSPSEPVWLLIHDNDRNNDHQLDLQEWLNAQIDDNLVVQFALTKNDFYRLDSNLDGYLSQRDGALNRALAYKISPCAAWAKEMHERIHKQMRSGK